MHRAKAEQINHLFPAGGSWHQRIVRIENRNNVTDAILVVLARFRISGYHKLELEPESEPKWNQHVRPERGRWPNTKLRGVRRAWSGDASGARSGGMEARGRGTTEKSLRPNRGRDARTQGAAGWQAYFFAACFRAFFFMLRFTLFDSAFAAFAASGWAMS